MRFLLPLLNLFPALDYLMEAPDLSVNIRAAMFMD